MFSSCSSEPGTTGVESGLGKGARKRYRLYDYMKKAGGRRRDVVFVLTLRPDLETCAEAVLCPAAG